MATYKTHQKEMLLEFLSKHPDRQFSVEQLSSELESFSDEAPGKSTVYRLIGQLVNKGTVKRFVKGNSRQFMYQIAGGDECQHHLHLKIQPLRNTIVRIPGPSWVENFCISKILPFVSR